MRAWILVLGLCLGAAGTACAGDYDDTEFDNIQPERETVKFHKEWFEPWLGTSSVQGGRPWPRTYDAGDAPARVAWPGKIGMVSGPPPEAGARAGDAPPLPKYRTDPDIIPYGGVGAERR